MNLTLTCAASSIGLALTGELDLGETLLFLVLCCVVGARMFLCLFWLSSGAVRLFSSALKRDSDPLAVFVGREKAR